MQKTFSLGRTDFIIVRIRELFTEGEKEAEPLWFFKD